MSSSLDTIIDSIKDKSEARLKLMQRGGQQTHIDCHFQKDPENIPHFFLLFPPDKLLTNIDFEAEHLLAVFQEDKYLNLNTKIIEQTDEQTLHLRANGLLDPASLREFFRINTATEITASYKTSSNEKVQTSWTIHGQTLDLSGSGTLALFGGKPRHSDNIILEIRIPNINTTVNAVGHIVHKKQLRNKRWLVAIHFDTISSKHRDTIITYLLSEQRRQLRQNIRTKDI